MFLLITFLRKWSLIQVTKELEVTCIGLSALMGSGKVKIGPELSLAVKGWKN